MRRSSVVRTLLTVAFAWLWLLPATAAAFPLSNCTLDVSSSRAGGAALDTAKSGDESGTSIDPFLVTYDGSVTWKGSSSIALKDNTYTVSVFGIPVLSGSGANASDNRSGDGTVKISEFLPVKVTGLYHVSGSITGSGGTCTGSGVIKLEGDPVGTAPFFAGLALIVIGVLLLVAAASGSLVGGVLGGLFAGLGMALEAILFGVEPVGALSPLVTVGLFIVAGAGLGLLRRGARRGSVAP